MDFNLSEAQIAWRTQAEALGRSLTRGVPAEDVVHGAASHGLVSPPPDLLAAVVAVEALAFENPAAAMTFALHTAVAAGLGSEARLAPVVRGERVGAIALSSNDVPVDGSGRVSGQATWVAPLTPTGLAVVGMRGDEGVTAAAVELDAVHVTQQPVASAALDGLVCGHLRLDRAPCISLGATMPFMARVRILLSAAGLGMGSRALHEALVAAHGHTGHGAGGEQTVQGLLADAATELDAARLLTWKAAILPGLSLASASMAKLAVTDATQRAVARATQVVGASSFERGHVVERLAQDVRALELFAGRTEALREAVAEEVLLRS